MPDSRPPDRDMLQALKLFLERDILPDLQGAKRFHCRVAVNVVAMLIRARQLDPAQTSAEKSRLRKLLPKDTVAADLNDLNRELAERIRSGAQDPFAPGLLDHIRQSLHDALSVNNPRWMQK